MAPSRALAAEAGLPAGVLNVVHGFGEEAGQPLVEDPRVAVVSLHGSTAVGRMIARVGRRAAREGLPRARRQEPARRLRRRRPRGGRRGRRALRLLQRRPALRRRQPDHRLRRGLRRVPRAAGRAGRGAEGRPGRRRRLRPGRSTSGSSTRMLAAVERARDGRGDGRSPAASGSTGRGFFIAPTIVEGAAADAEISRTELFGPITTLHRVAGFEEALALANASPYGLTAAIWTRSIHRAQEFVGAIVSGRRAGQRPDVRLRAAHAVRRPERTRATAGASRAPRRSMSTPTGRPSTSHTTRAV